MKHNTCAMSCIILLVSYNLDISGLAAELRFFARAAVLANRGPIVQKSAGHKRHHPVESSTRVCLGAEEGAGQSADQDAKVWKAAVLDHCLQLTRLIGFSFGQAGFCCQARVPLHSGTHRWARTHDHKVKGLALCRLS